MEDSISRNFGIMNNFFLSLNDEITDVDENLFCPSDSWKDSKTYPSDRTSSPIEVGFEGKVVKDLSKAENLPNSEEYHKRQFNCQDIFDSEDEEFQKDFFGEFSRPKSCGTIPKSRLKLSSNISDPCLLSCLPNETTSNHSPEIPASGDQSINDSQMNSLDSGIPDDAGSGTSQVCSVLFF